MLKGISPVITPDLLDVLNRMGHGDEIVLADAHFPGDTLGRITLWSGCGISQLLDAILPLLELDAYAEAPLVMMAAVEGDSLDPRVEDSYMGVIRRHFPEVPPIQRIGRFDFYDRAAEAFAVVMTAETAKYGNLLLRKGVTPTEGRS